MRRVLLVIFLLCAGHAGAQVLNTAQVIGLGHWGLTAVPVLVMDGSENRLHGKAMIGVGLGGGVDVSLSAFGSPYTEQYTSLGADIEWSLLGSGGPGFSMSAGGHVSPSDKVGIDATLNLTFPIRTVAIYGGVDADFDFPKNSDMELPIWGFGGAEVSFSRFAKLLIEVDIAATEQAWSMLGVGLALFF
jgi:hypothetical protein